MNKYEQIFKWYHQGLWTKKMVRNAVMKNWITEDEYKKIVGEDY